MNVLLRAQVEAKNVVQSVIEKTHYWDRVNKLSLDDKKTKILERLFASEPEGFQGGMTAKKYVNLTGVSKPTATRNLTELVNLNCLISVGGGRSTHYQLALKKYITS